MGTTYRFIESPEKSSSILAWFSSLNQPPEITETPRYQALYFREFGALSHYTTGGIDVKHSPLVTVFLPRVIRGHIWSVGEVHFLATPLKEQFPELHKVSTSFSKWLRQSECVFSNKLGTENKWNYYLQGAIQNYDPPVYALPSGLSALKEGRYFVTDGESEGQIERLCQTLQLRGIEFN